MFSLLTTELERQKDGSEHVSEVLAEREGAEHVSRLLAVKDGVDVTLGQVSSLHGPDAKF
jgi:hypothetical protein